MAQIFMRRGNTFVPEDDGALNVHETLPPGTYSIGITPAGFHLEQIADFELPSKLYGDVNRNAERILNTFADRPAGTGVLLSGQKGSGKTMLTKRIAQLALQQGIITILVNQQLCGESFNSFIQSINQPAVILFDEFEKVYDREHQQALLTIFDGTYSAKRLFLLTCNERHRIDDYMHNRPGRLYYALDFGGLESDFITEYCQDNLKNLDRLSGVLTVAGCFAEFSFDMLKALVEEMNRYDETATEAMKVLNMKPQHDSGGRYTVCAVRNGEKVVAASEDGGLMSYSPFQARGWNLWLYAPDEDDKDVPAGCITETEHYVLNPADIIKVDWAKGQFVFKTKRADTIIYVERQRVSSPMAGFNYDAF